MSGFNQESSGYVSDDTIFITGLPEDTNEEKLSKFFGQIGIIKFDKRNKCPKIWIYKDKTTGKGKGEATITYDDPPTASSAINWFNGKEFEGNTITVQLAERKTMPQFMTRGGGRGGPRGGAHRSDGGGGGRGFERGGGGGGYRSFDRGGDRNDRGSDRGGDRGFSGYRSDRNRQDRDRNDRFGGGSAHRFDGGANRQSMDSGRDRSTDRADRGRGGGAGGGYRAHRNDRGNGPGGHRFDRERSGRPNYERSGRD